MGWRSRFFRKPTSSFCKPRFKELSPVLARICEKRCSIGRQWRMRFPHRAGNGRRCGQSPAYGLSVQISLPPTPRVSVAMPSRCLMTRCTFRAVPSSGRNPNCVGTIPRSSLPTNRLRPVRVLLVHHQQRAAFRGDEFVALRPASFPPVGSDQRKPRSTACLVPSAAVVAETFRIQTVRTPSSGTGGSVRAVVLASSVNGGEPTGCK